MDLLGINGGRSPSGASSVGECQGGKWGGWGGGTPSQNKGEKGWAKGFIDRKPGKRITFQM